MDRLHPSGDMRLRYERDGSRGGGKDTRHRPRARLRFGLGIDISEEVMAGLRLRTGNSSDANSPHQTFGNEFNSWEFSLDRAYLRYSPKWAEGAWIEGGKMASPFKTNPVYGELVWDADINPEGGQAGYRWSNDGLALGVATGIWVLNIDGSGDNSSTATIFPVQAYAECTCVDDLKVTTAVAFYKYGDLGGGGVRDAPTSTSHRVDPISGKYESDFEVLDAFSSITYTGLALPITAVGELIYNFGAERDSEASGWAVGGSTKVPLAGKKHRVFYQFQNIKKDALYAPNAQDDFQSRRTHMKGHIAGVDWQLTKAVKLRTWGLFETDRGDGSNGTHSKNRLRVDINVKF